MLVLWVMGCGLWGPSAPPPAAEPVGDAAPPEGLQIPADADDMPEALRCPVDRRGDAGCWRRLDGGTLRAGAQASDPSAPGYDPAAGAAEGPVREVTVAPVWMLGWVVTAMDFGRCVEAGWCSLEAVMPDGPLSTVHHGDMGLHPAVGVSWAGAQRYCAWFGGRLPTEAEWELAARAGESGPYVGGADMSGLGELAWYRENTTGTDCADYPLEVAEKASNSWGLYDVHGNVAEWTLDWYGGDYSGDEADPVGADSGSDRVHRGGSWHDSAGALRLAARDTEIPAGRSCGLGLRLVRTAPQGTSE